MPLESRVVSATLAVPADKVYDYARHETNLPRWAAGLATGVREENGQWFADSPMGRVRIVMAPHNDFGVLDHDVTTPNGDIVHNAMRVVPAGDGSLLSFVLLRLPGVSSEDFERDAAHVARDLQALKALLENAS